MLKEYDRKRNFVKTPEPVPNEKAMGSRVAKVDL